MTLQDSVVFFTREAHSLACLSLTCGDRERLCSAWGGVRNLAGEPLEEEDLFDLASLTKLFTGLSVMRLHEEGLLDLRAPVTKYAGMFANLSDVSVEQVLGFQVRLTTARRVDTQPDREAALRELFAISPEPLSDGRAYSDMHAMVLKYVIEGAGKDSYMHVLKSRILNPLGMKNTFGYVPAERRPSCVSCDREHRIEGKQWILRETPAGIPHDPKARRLNTEEDVTGHAGLFSNQEDLVRLCRGVLAEKIVSGKALRYMAENRTGHPLPGGGYTQFLGAQCYVRHPEQRHSEVPLYMSDRALALSGFTGHHLSLDPETGLFVISLGSRVLNRLSVLVPEDGKTNTDYGLAPDGRGQILWPDGEKVWSSAGYVYLKDAHMHKAVADTLGLS